MLDGAIQNTLDEIPPKKPLKPSLRMIDSAASIAPVYCVLLDALLLPCTCNLVLITSCNLFSSVQTTKIYFKLDHAFFKRIEPIITGLTTSNSE